MLLDLCSCFCWFAEEGFGLSSFEGFEERTRGLLGLKQIDMKKKIPATPKDRSTSRGSVYYPGCRKDAQCSCNMCMASIRATLDLRPSNNLFSSLTVTNSSDTPINKFSSSSTSATVLDKEDVWPSSEQSKNKPPITPPRKEQKKRVLVNRLQSPPSVKAPSGNAAQVGENSGVGSGSSVNKMKWRPILGKLWIVFGVFMVDFVLPQFLHGLFQPVFSARMLRGFAEQSMSRPGLANRLDFVGRRMAGVVAEPARVSNCTGLGATWRLKENGLMVHSRCVLYSSIVEEVSLWGFPAQTSGVIGRGFSDRSFTVMSGKVLEWYEGRTESSVYSEGDSWIHKKWTASLVQVDRSWILEYKPSAMMQGRSFLLQSLTFLKWLLSHYFENIKMRLGSFSLPNFTDFKSQRDVTVPT